MTMSIARAGGHALVCVALVASFAAAPDAAAEPASADVAVELTTEPFGAGLGEPVEHRIAIRNRGPATATDVAVSFTTSLPVVTADLKDGGHCTLTDGTALSCHWSKLRPTGEAAPLTVVLRGRLAATPPLGGLVRNTAAVGTAAPGPRTADDTSANAYLLDPVPVEEAAPVASAPAAVAAAAPKPSRTPLYTIFTLLLAVAVAAMAAGFLARRRDPFAALRQPAGSLAGRVRARFARRAAATEQVSR
ncbi:DUF11 domain-containing protein [Phytomonospora endophytica]|uniref:Putative repeat protein (TIGR01451 family) n=1 Tax=Phytomonospora endophytica TaxID=714109 RepID=A0A841FP06_9ACTN|nr:DUF11 domain-containing protein [Phytomonospora endophytica]MBB6037835.1 putative repeat protein (TIGR01451 family) [Phytomonospora endophytica]GIG68734.1 hypothetical protein Pen01_50290 [Phytomonospora endophytica]